jgi:Protein of unknown function (DUF4238)
VSSPKKIHLITQAYLDAWTSGGLLRPVSTRYGRQKLKSTSAVGWRREWWGEDDGPLNQVCEENCGKLETVLPEALATVESGWPLGLKSRSVVAQFLALHTLRTDAFARWFAPMRDSSLARLRDRFPNERAYQRFCATMQSDRERSKRLLRLINKLSSILVSMHWTLLRFEEPLLITSDQPLCPVPFLTPGVASPVAAVPADGWLDTCEIRFPLTPRLALLTTWYMGPPSAPVPGTWAQAVNLNSAVAKQAVEQYFQTPEREPAMPAAIFRASQNLLSPISIDVLAGYSMTTARTSPLRHRTSLGVRALIEAQDHETITAITSEVREAEDRSLSAK